ncbi:F-box domain-containing protein [Salix suchowensis]|nr:F-box domain-containing protein [Salix suchowensis]
MLLKRCPDLEEITLCSFSSSARLLAFDRITAGRFPKLHTLTLGSFGYTSDFTISYPGSDTSTFSDFLANHDSLKHIRLSWNFKRWYRLRRYPCTSRRPHYPIYRHTSGSTNNYLSYRIRTASKLAGEHWAQPPPSDKIYLPTTATLPEWKAYVIKGISTHPTGKWPWTLNSKSAHWNATGVRETQGGGDGSKVNGGKKEVCVVKSSSSPGMAALQSCSHQLQMNWGENTNKTCRYVLSLSIRQPGMRRGRGYDQGRCRVQECSLANWREDADKRRDIYHLVDSAARNDQ